MGSLGVGGMTIGLDKAVSAVGRAGDGPLLMALFEAALGAALPDGKFEGRLPIPPTGRTIVLGAGKGSARMAQVFEQAYHRPCEGLVVTRYGHAAPTWSIEIVEAAHPVPDEAGMAAAKRILQAAQAATADDLVVALISGGASAVLSVPAEGVGFEDKQAINKALLRSGAPIGAMNTVRKALSAIKGGRLAAAAHPARLVTYVISDVPGDDPAVIGSGPTVPERPDPEAALKILAQYAIPVSADLERAIRANTAQGQPLPPADIHMLATPKMSLDAAAEVARRNGIEPIMLGDDIEGEARQVAESMAAQVRATLIERGPGAAPCVLLSGGETTVTIKGQGGRGGRNAEFLLALAVALDGLAGVSAIACDTDGIDGSEDNAGAWIDPSVGTQARERGLDLRAFLDAHDAYSAFAALDRLVVTGPTLTNVNDFRAILIRPIGEGR